MSQSATGSPVGRCQRNTCLGLMIALAMLFAHSVGAQGPLSNGDNHTGTLVASTTNTYTFNASAGNALVFRVGSTNFTPRIVVFGPGGVAIGSIGYNSGFNHDAMLTLQATNTGAFTVAVSSFYAGGSGTYALRFVQIPGTFVVPGGDEGGTLINGSVNPGTIELGDLDVWSFDATNGNNVLLRVGTTGFTPYLFLYGPNGALVGSAGFNSGFNHDTLLSYQPTNSGTFTVVLSSYYLDHQSTASGTYNLTLAQSPGAFVVSPGDQGGPMTNGAVHPGTIALGELDMWSFTATNGNSIVLRVGTTGFTPYLFLYGPNGTLIGSEVSNSGFNHDAYLTVRATNSGTFTVVLASYYYDHQGGASGTYNLTLALPPDPFVVSPGDEGGDLTNGAVHAGTIALGELDMWSFTANTGDSIALRVGTSGFTPYFFLYGPNGAVIAAEWSNHGLNHDAYIAVRATNSGTFTVVLSSFFYDHSAGASGTYNVTLARMPGGFVVSPGDEGGTLTNGASNLGTLTLGELDMWSFTANTGEGVMLRVGTSNFTPWVNLYGPNGALIGTAGINNGANHDNYINFQVTNSGTFTVVLGSYFYDHVAPSAGSYALSLVHAPGDLVITPGDEGGTLTNGFVNVCSNSIGDLDAWKFYGTPGDSNVFRIVTTNFTPWMRLYSPAGALLRDVFINNGANRSNGFNFVITNAGDYILVVSAAFVDQSGTYALKQSRVPPDLIVPGTVFINEGATLNVPISAQDPDIPDKALTFTKISAPAGVVLTPSGNTNATITWPTDETTGPSTNTIVLSVTDNVSGRDFIRTNSFIVIVNELNEPPVLTVPSPQIINEITPLIVQASATDPDIPVNPRTFSLVSPPAGMTINPNTGAITWTPTEAQGPLTNIITVVVTDTNPPAVNTTSISVTNSFTVTVREVNVAPVLTVPGNQIITELTSLNVSASATDADLPTNVLTFSLVSPPAGVTINPNTGAIGWTPTEVQGSNAYTITVMVTDNSPQAVNLQQLSDTESFTVTVNEANIPPRFTSVPTNQIITELVSLNLSVAAADDDLPGNPLAYGLVSPPTGMTINTNTGAITWTPTEAQGSNSYTITITVTDTNRDAINQKQLTATTNFNVTVNESNSPPRFTSVPGAQIITELTPLNLSVTGADDDQPANTLTFALVSPPAGMIINSNSGAITWTPSEAQGSNFYTITVTVSDTNPPAINQKQFTITTNFTVTVNESNSPPILTVPGPQTLDELTLLSVSASATDSDSPANPLLYALISPPAGMNINSNSGAITWTPTEAQGGSPFVFNITVTVTDTNRDAINQKQFIVTNSFTVTVNESNSPPVLQSIANQSLHYGIPLGIQSVATDVDLPTNTLSFTLDVFPSNMTINAASGLISWTPVLAQFGTNTATVRVTDNGSPLRFDTKTFTLVVTGSPPVLAISPTGGNLKQIAITGDTGLNYDLLFSTNLVNWDLLLHFNLNSSPYQYVDPASATAPRRYYRLKLAP